MKKIYILAVSALTLAACQKTGTEITSPLSSVKANLTVSMPNPLTKANYSLTTPANPVGGMTVTWKENDILTLIVFQGENKNWKDNFIYQDIVIPAAAEGQTSTDLSAAMSPLDLSGFDSEKNLKYVVVYNRNGFNKSWKEFTIWNGIPYISYSYGISAQINAMGMIAETDVQEVAFPSGDLVLSGKLHWITSVLAVQFDIDSAADITYPEGSLIFNLTGSTYPDCYTPITKTAGVSYEHACPIRFTTGKKLSEALDANGCRYFTIPADGMTTNASMKVGGSNIGFRFTPGSINYTSSGSIGNVTIEGGKVYGIKVKVTDSDSDGVPEFTKM